jgi:CrcB protein
MRRQKVGCALVVERGRLAGIVTERDLLNKVLFGAMARHPVNHVIRQRALTSSFPPGIFIVNVLGSFVIGALAGALAGQRLHLSHEWRVFLIVGALGGFTTSSSLSLDTLTPVRDGNHAHAAANVIGHVGLSLAAVWSGFSLLV